MSRSAKLLAGVLLIVFILACNTLTQPIRDVQQVAGTVESVASQMPLATLQAIATSLPVETLQAIPSALPTELSGLENAANPQDKPLEEWKDIPIPSSAIAGNESPGIYSFTAKATVQELFDYYKKAMADNKWNEIFSMPDTGSGALLTYEKDGYSSTITITADPNNNGQVLVFLTYQ